MAKGKVLIEAVKEKTGRTSVANPYAKSNVNVAQGPRTGNEPSSAKRSAFKAAKEERAPLATMIEDAYAKRQHEYEDFEYTNGGSIVGNIKEEFKRKTRK